MSVTFSGLASGIDTTSIIESIIEVEAAPKTLLEDQKEYLQTKIDTYTEFNTLLDSFYAAVIGLNSTNDLNSFQATNNGAEYFSISTNSLANEGTYSVEVVSLAQQQKDVSSNGIADKDTTTLTGELQIGDETLNYDGCTLNELVDLINTGDYGITASLIDDGLGNGYRLMVTADAAGKQIEILGTGDLTLDTLTNGHSVQGTKAHVIVDGIDYYSSSNSVTNAIKGATLTLLDVSDSGADKVSIQSDAESIIATQMEEMVAAFNTINTYVDTIYASDSTLGSSLKSVQRSLKNYLTNSGLVSLGIASDWQTGELSFDSDTFATAYAADPDGVKVTLLGDGDSEGIMNRLDDYMSDQLNASTGFMVTKNTTLENQISRLEDSISAMETRLEKRQEVLEAQFSAMETLMSSLNSQGDYLTSFFESYNTSS